MFTKIHGNFLDANDKWEEGERKGEGPVSLMFSGTDITGKEKHSQKNLECGKITLIIGELML